MRQQVVVSAILFTLLPALVHGFSFQLDNTPTQCQNSTFQIIGSGIPPYSLVLIPYGLSTLPNNVDVRIVQNIQFSPNATSLSVQLIYPGNTQFVAVVSDSTGFGNGGTSTGITVQSSTDASCFDPSKNASVPFYFYLSPDQLIQCEPSRLWWDSFNGTLIGILNFQAIIPGGQSFNILHGDVTIMQQEGSGYDFIPSIRAGTTVVIVGGDDRQMGNAGSVLYTVSSAGYNNDTCIDSSSPSSTPGSPAGGIVTPTVSPTVSSTVSPTVSSTVSPVGSHTSNSLSSTSVGGIAGGVVGGVVVLVVAIFATIFIRRRRRRQKSSKERATIFLDNDDDNEYRDHSSRYCEPEPFTLTESVQDSSSREQSTSDPPGQQAILDTYVADDPPSARTQSGASKKSPAPPSVQQFNVIVHEDAGPSMIEGEEPRTVELPPAYTNIRS